MVSSAVPVTDVMDLRLGQQAVHEGGIDALRAEFDAGSRDAAPADGRALIEPRLGDVAAGRAARVRELEPPVQAAGTVRREGQCGRRGQAHRPIATQRNEPIAGGAEVDVAGEEGTVALGQVRGIYAHRPIVGREVEVALIVDGDRDTERGREPCVPGSPY